jgi:undecaprenyl-diphosphatase
MSLDLALFELVNQRLTHPWLDAAMPTLTSWGSWKLPLVAVLVGVALFGGPRLRRHLVWLALCVGAADLVSSQLLKPLVGRLRPSYCLTGVRLLVPAKGSFSFPSSHAVNLAAGAWFLHRTFRRRWVSAASFLLLALVSYSRIYVGVHYPSDVLFGIAVGLGVGASALRVRRAFFGVSEPGVAPKGAPRTQSEGAEGDPLAHPKPDADFLGPGPSERR